MVLSPADAVRFWFAAAVWLLPGFAFLRFLGPRWRRDPIFALAAAAAAAVGISSLLAWLCLLGGWPANRFHLVLSAAALVSLVLLFAPRPSIFRRATASPTEVSIPDIAPMDPLPSWMKALGVISLLALALWGMHVGASLRYTSDAPDHVGTLREILASGSYFPSDALYRNAGLLGMDARKGLLHPVYAALCRLSGLDPVAFWCALPSITLLFPFLSAYGFLRLSGVSFLWSFVGGGFVFLTWGGGPGGDLIAISPFPNNLGATLSWFASGCLIAVLRHRERAVIALAVISAVAAAATHPMFAIFLALSYLLLGLWALLFSPSRKTSLTRLVGAGLWTVLLLGPYFAYRYASYAPRNPIHTELQGMLLLGQGLFVADPGLMWKHLGWVGLVAYPLLLVLYRRRWRADPASFFFFSATLIMPLLAFDPVLVPLLQKKITYLVFRSFWFFPPALAAAACLPPLMGGRQFDEMRARQPLAAGLEKARPIASHGASRLSRRRGIGLAVLAVALLVPALRGAPVWFTPSRLRDAPRDPRVWRDALRKVESVLSPGDVVLSDPVTSHVLPAFTSLKVAAPYDQHSPPNDALAIERILLARDVLSPSVSPRHAWELTRRAHAGSVLFHLAWARPPITDYWMFDSGVLRERARQLASSPFFTPTLHADGFFLLRVVATPPERSLLRSRNVQSNASVPVGFAPSDTLFQRDGLALVGATVASRNIVCGDTLRVALRWAAVQSSPPAGPATATLRLDALNAPGRRLFAGKVLRKIAERLRGKRYRARCDWIPTENRLPPDRWVPGRTVADTVLFSPPCFLAPGRYSVRVAVNRFPHMPNHHLRDYLNDKDIYSGASIDTITIRSPRSR